MTQDTKAALLDRSNELLNRIEIQCKAVGHPVGGIPELKLLFLSALSQPVAQGGLYVLIGGEGRDEQAAMLYRNDSELMQAITEMVFGGELIGYQTDVAVDIFETIKSGKVYDFEIGDIQGIKLLPHPAALKSPPQPAPEVVELPRVQLETLTGTKALEQIQHLKKVSEVGGMAWGVDLSYQSLCIIEQALQMRMDTKAYTILEVSPPKLEIVKGLEKALKDNWRTRSAENCGLVDRAAKLHLQRQRGE